jgi:tagaturonate epimerase
MKRIEKYTIGMGDRFTRQGEAQLAAVCQATREGIDVFPVWNKSNREHTIVGSHPDSLRAEADAAVAALGWKHAYYVDADHIGLATVDRFLAASDFFTIDVADAIGKPAAADRQAAALRALGPSLGAVDVPGLPGGLRIDFSTAEQTVGKFLPAVEEAGRIYRHIAAKRHDEEFVTEVSMDETDAAQTPEQLFVILKLLADEGIPVQTIAPKFTGRFNKGVDYVGDLARFEQEFAADLCVLAFARDRFGLPDTLKLSVHSGSDKFSLYPVIRKLLRQHQAGGHVKTAGTTWLEEVIGLAESDGEALTLAKEIYAQALEHYDDLTGPYATVIDIDKRRLPTAADVAGWSAERYVSALRHVPSCPEYNPHFRQLLHVAFKIAAKKGQRYFDALERHAAVVNRNVTENLLDRHIRPIFG